MNTFSSNIFLVSKNVKILVLSPVINISSITSKLGFTLTLTTLNEYGLETATTLSKIVKQAGWILNVPSFGKYQ